MIVVDASAAIEVLLGGRCARSVGQRLFAPRHALVAPELLDIEVAQVLRRFELRSELSPSRGCRAEIEVHGAD